MFLTMLHTPPQPACFLREIFAHRLRWLVIGTENSRLMRARVARSDISFTAQATHEKIKTTFAAMVLTTNLLRLIAMHASPSRSLDLPQLRKTNGKGCADKLHWKQKSGFLMVQYEPPVLQNVRGRTDYSISDSTTKSEQTPKRATSNKAQLC